MRTRPRATRALVLTLLCAALATSQLPAQAREPFQPAKQWREVFSPDGTITKVLVPAQPQPRVPPDLPEARIAAVTPIQQTGPSSRRFDLVFVGDGYTSSQLGAFAQHARSKWAQIASVEPFRAYRGLFNVWIVDVVSRQSGVDNDPFGTRRDTALDMRFYCSGIARLLCVNESAAIAYARQAPDADQVIALGNSTTYGGAGGTVATASGGNSRSGLVAIHELGHSIGGLADEYDNPGGLYSGPDPRESNVTIYTASQLTRFRHKWYRWIGRQSPDGGVVSTYEGARYRTRGIYRPTFNSVMRTLGQPFNLPGREAMIQGFYRRAGLLGGGTGVSTVSRAGTLRAAVPPGIKLDVRWYVNGKEVTGLRGATGATPAELGAPAGARVTVRVSDRSSWVRDEVFRARHMTATRSWMVTG